jgi:hypothetical protein
MGGMCPTDVQYTGVHESGHHWPDHRLPGGRVVPEAALLRGEKSQSLSRCLILVVGPLVADIEDAFNYLVTLLKKLL